MKVNVTPILAAEWLKFNSKNRPISASTVNRYSEEMLKGNWVYNGESIKISDEGIILDGQHRLNAIIKSGKTIDVEVIDDIKNDTFGTIDQGRARTNSDNFSMRGVKNYTFVASIINPLYAINCKNPKSVNSSSLSKKDAYAYYLLKKDFINASSANRKIFAVPKKYIGACEAYLNQFNNKEIVEDFFNQLSSGVISPNSNQILLLREWFIKIAVDKLQKPNPAQYIAKILKAFKNIKEGKNPPFIRWSELGKEQFPFDIKHNSKKEIKL